MRIAQLDLKAFGHFSERRIVFAGGNAAGGGDFHIAYGPNEAGKTTISRALKAALFGIPERTTDNHRHANPSLRVGVVLARASGEQLAAMRRKARKNSLLRYDAQSGEELGEAIADELLSQWLGGLSEGLYTSMFGLDHDELVAGGKALSEGKGELGQSLFEAGAGLSSIRTLRERLAKEADDLFRPRAPSTAIFKELDHYAVARRAARDAQTRPAEWETLRKHADEAGSAYEAARRQQENLQRDARRLERLAAVLPDIAARALARERLAALGEVRRLPADAPGERIAAETRLRQAELARNDATDKLSRQQAELAAIVLPQALLQEGGAVEALYYALDAFRGARETAVRAQGTMVQADRQSIALLAAIGETLCGESLGDEALYGESLSDDPRSLIPGVTLRARVQSQVTGGATLRAEHDAASRLAVTTRRELDELNGEIGELGSPQVPVALLAAIDAFDAEGNPELSAQAAARQVASLEAALLREAAALGEDSPAALAAIGTPLPAEVQQFRSRRDALEIRQQTLGARIEGIENDTAAVNGELAGLLRQGEVPTVEQLGARRAHRESLWQTIRRRLFAEAGTDNLPLAALPSAAEREECEEYEQAVNGADATADRRFADAARVAQHADLLKRLAQMGNALDLERGRLAAAGQDGNELATQWQALLAKYALPALDAAELADWLNKRDAFLQRYGACADFKNDAALAAARAASVRAELSAALQA
ncbi:MAG: AAA family ATPase, partial [Rhodocyclaceae bacterium]